jgi:hypothetical protein
MEEPTFRVRWSRIDFAGWTAVVPPQLFVASLVFFNREGSRDLLSRLSFRLRWLWLSITRR